MIINLRVITDKARYRVSVCWDLSLDLPCRVLMEGSILVCTLYYATTIKGELLIKYFIYLDY